MPVSTAGAVCWRSTGSSVFAAAAPLEVYRQNFAEKVCRCERVAVSTGVSSTAHRSVDQIDGSLEGGVYSQIRGVEQVRVWRLAQGCRRPVLVSFVAAFDVGEQVSLAHDNSRLL